MTREYRWLDPRCTEGTDRPPALHPSKPPAAWPCLMCEVVAACCLGQIAIPTFRREVAAKRMPEPVGAVASLTVSLACLGRRRNHRATIAPRARSARAPMPTTSSQALAMRA
jgi:hypothetical protein